MKKITILTMLILGACGEKTPYCEIKYSPNVCEEHNIRREVFSECLDKLSKMRNSGGGNYTTNDDEDLDEAIRACGSTSFYVSNDSPSKTVCGPNPSYIAQQEFCKGGNNE